MEKKSKSNLLIITEAFNFDNYQAKLTDIFINLDQHTKGINFINCKCDSKMIN